MKKDNRMTNLRNEKFAIVFRRNPLTTHLVISRTCRFNTDILQEGDTAGVKGQ